jgi:hypothetical protein
MVLQTAVLSFLLIFLIHHLIEFFQKTLTAYKEKDMRPSKKYETILKKIEEEPPHPQTVDMKKELKDYMNSVLTKL